VREELVQVATSVNHRAMLRQPQPNTSATLNDDDSVTLPTSTSGS